MTKTSINDSFVDFAIKDIKMTEASINDVICAFKLYLVKKDHHGFPVGARAHSQQEGWYWACTKNDGVDVDRDGPYKDIEAAAWHAKDWVDDAIDTNEWPFLDLRAPKVVLEAQMRFMNIIT